MSPGCEFTVTFWFRLLEEPFTRVLSTFKQNNDHSTGISIGFNRDMNGDILVGVSFTTPVPSRGGLRTTGMMYPGVWHHFAFAYHNITQFALYIDFVRRTTSNHHQIHGPDYTPVPIPEAYMANGYRNQHSNQYRTLSGFGLLDELAIFSGILSESQVMQLQISE